MLFSVHNICFHSRQIGKCKNLAQAETPPIPNRGQDEHISACSSSKTSYLQISTIPLDMIYEVQSLSESLMDMTEIIIVAMRFSSISFVIIS